MPPALEAAVARKRVSQGWNSLVRIRWVGRGRRRKSIRASEERRAARKRGCVPSTPVVEARSLPSIPPVEKHLDQTRAGADCSPAFSTLRPAKKDLRRAPSWLGSSGTSRAPTGSLRHWKREPVPHRSVGCSISAPRPGRRSPSSGRWRSLRLDSLAIRLERRCTSIRTSAAPQEASQC